MKSLDARTLRVADVSRDAAYEVINGIVPYPGRPRLDAHSRYIFAYSLYATCARMDLTRYLCSLSAMTAGEQLEMILLQAVKEKSYGFINLTGGMQLEELGTNIGFSYFAVAANAFRAMAAYAENDDFSATSIALACAELRALAPTALDQCRASKNKTAQLKSYLRYVEEISTTHRPE